MKPEQFVEELEEGLGDGPLTLCIVCTKCDAQYELSKESAAMALLLNASFLEYLKYVQNSPCRSCNP